MMSSGNIEGQDINARDIVTGLKIENLTVVLNAVDDLGQGLNQAQLRFQHSDQAGLELFSGEERLLTLPPHLLEAIKLLPRRATTGLTATERQRLYAAWLVTRQPVNPPQRVAARRTYIPLPGHTSWDRDDDVVQPGLCYLRVTGQGAERRFEREGLPDVTAAVNRFPAFVLLGPPGSGKSTVLERLAYTGARDFLADTSRRLPLWVTLAGYHWQRQTPLAFVREQCRTLGADDFVDLARAGQLLLLADGLNEMPRLPNPDDMAQRAAAWHRFLAEFFAEDSAHSSRAVLASRDAEDYEQRLGLPRVELDRLDAAQISGFARAYLADDAEPFLADLERLGLAELAEIPFSLYVLTQQYDQTNHRLPANRGRLFRDYAQDLLGVMYPHQDQARLVAGQALAHLGYVMQETGEGTVLPAVDMIARLPEQVMLPGRRRRRVTLDPEAVFDRAWRAGLLSQVSADDDTFKFSHQLLQEQFAAQRMLARRQAMRMETGWWRTARTPAEMPAPEVGEWDPLPPPPATGWERTTILAAGMLTHADGFVTAVLAASPALAGRCLSEGSAAVYDVTRNAVQQALLADMSDPALHRRTRLQAGQLLAATDDPRFEPVTLNDTPVVLPPLVRVAGGTATLGSDDEDAFSNQQPVRQVEVPAFWLGRYPVTNAEYRCFCDAGGYDQEQYWTPAGWEWRQGRAETSGAVETIMETYQMLVNGPQLIDQLLNEGGVTRDWAESWRGLIQRPAEEVRALAVQQFGKRRTDQPYYWDDPAYNRANQPVVGVTWYEAAAYCAWVNAQVAAGGGNLPAPWPELQTLIQQGKVKLTLPGEVEWEWAAGGPQHWRYPWGPDFDPERANTLEGRVLGTSPVGAYPGGAATCGAEEMAGNVYEWTRSQYRPYPYRAGDGREDAPGGTGVRMTLRGGAWTVNLRYARVSYRNDYFPDDFLSTLGFRVVAAPIL
jgi:formylglycine-generating enzyme required for sulfatase activity